MTKAINVLAEIADLPILENRNETTEAEAAAAFAELAPFGPGAIFAGGFSGESPWERHQNGDELVQILKGATKLTLLMPDEKQELDMQAGMIAVVPQGVWHRFNAPDGVTLMTATPQPTDISDADDPRE
jgi:mannose-6-phosphate isomerase-like protein (cupin superfamily)